MNKQNKLEEAIKWIAYNDNAVDTEPEDIAGYITVCMVADLFEVKQDWIARRVSEIRIAAGFHR